MPTIRLDSSPNLYVGCPSYGNPKDLIYIRDFTNEPSARDIAQLDPNSASDVLIVYGTEIKGDSLRRLGKCTQLQNRSGSFRINCNGASYVGAGGPWHRSVDNVIFDWSLFGVTLPNSSNHSLIIQLNEKNKVIEELNKQLLELKSAFERKESQGVINDDHVESRISCMASDVESIKAEVESTKKTLIESMQEVREKDSKLHEMSQRVSLLDRELDVTKLKLEQSISVSCLMQEAMNHAKDESKWYRQEITAMRMELAHHGRVSRK